MRKALVIIDMQNDFVTGALGTKEAQAMLPSLVKKLQTTEADLFFTKDTHGEDYMNTNEGKHLPVKHCIRGTEGWEIVPELEQWSKDNCVIVEKSTFGSTTQLPKLLAKYDEIELCGLCTDICVVSNALILRANFPEKYISLDASCCAGVTPEAHKAALLVMKNCQIEVEG